MRVKPTFGFDLGFSVSGHVRLAQADPHTGQESFILLSPSEIEILVREFRCLLDEVGDWWEPTQDDGEES